MQKAKTALTTTTLALLAALSWLHTKPTHASDQENHTSGPWYLADQQKGWYFDGTIGFENEPTYAGSDKYASEADISARAIYRTQTGHRYFINLGELGAIFQFSPDLIVQTVLEYEEAREVEEDNTLAGLNEGEATLEGQITIARRFGNFTLGAVLQPDLLSRGKGLVTFLAASYDKTLLSDKLHLHTGIDFSWGDDEHMQTEFGITDAEASNTNFASYSPGAGYKSTTLNLGLEYWITSKVSLLAITEMELYASNASESPLLADEGSDTTYEAALALRYSF